MDKYLNKLHVTGRTPRTQQAIRNLERICEDELGGRYELVVIDVLKRPQLAEDEKLLATPTVVKELPVPIRCVIGDLSDTERVLLVSIFALLDAPVTIRSARAGQTSRQNCLTRSRQTSYHPGWLSAAFEDRTMPSVAARLAGALAVVALAIGFARGDDTDPVYEGQKVSKWIDTVQNDPSARKRSLAVEALGKIWVAHKHKDAIPNVCRALRVDTSAAVRTQAALVLGGLRPEDKDLGSKTLIDTLGTEKESRVRKEIIAAMSKFPEVCALGVEPLITALKDPEPTVKIAAAEALALAGSQQKTMAKSAAPGLEPLLKDSDKAVRMAAVYALGRIQPEGATTIAETMAAMLGTEKDADMKRELVSSLGLLAEKAPVILKALAATLTDPDDELRRRSARVLGTFGTDAASVADDLYKVLTTDKLKDIRVDAVRAFGSAIGTSGVKSRVKDFLTQFDPAKQPDFEVRLALVEEVGALGYEHLGADLVSTNPAVKAAAQEVMGALRLRLSDPQVKVREAAGIAIRKIEKKPEPKKDPEKKDP